MITFEKINETIFNALDEINQLLPDENKIEKKEDTVLYGAYSRLDSLGLVNLIVTVEQRVQDELGRSIDLTDEKALSRKNSPFLTVKTLSDYISSLLNNEY